MVWTIPRAVELAVALDVVIVELEMLEVVVTTLDNVAVIVYKFKKSEPPQLSPALPAHVVSQSLEATAMAPEAVEFPQ